MIKRITCLLKTDYMSITKCDITCTFKASRCPISIRFESFETKGILFTDRGNTTTQSADLNLYVRKWQCK